MKVLFLLNGLGLGNSTRCHAVMQRLHKRGATMEAITSGNGLWYFQDKPELRKVHVSQPLHYGSAQGKISIWRTFAAPRDIIRSLNESARALNEVLVTFRPNVVVTDSEYVFRPAKRQKIPIVAINNADLVSWNYRRFGDAPVSVAPQFYCIELLDALFHKIVPDVVVSPALGLHVPNDSGRIKHVGPIVREGYLAKDSAKAEDRSVIMLSGSNFGTQVTFGSNPPSMAVDILGRDEPESWRPIKTVTFHGKIKNTLPFFRRANVMVVNGGCSAVSEAISMRKPVVVVPVPRHAEQWTNARVIEELGIGVMSDEAHYANAMMGVHNRIDQFHANYESLSPVRDGAEEAAEIIASAAN